MKDESHDIDNLSMLTTLKIFYIMFLKYLWSLSWVSHCHPPSQKKTRKIICTKMRFFKSIPNNCKYRGQISNSNFQTDALQYYNWPENLSWNWRYQVVRNLITCKFLQADAYLTQAIKLFNLAQSIVLNPRYIDTGMNIFNTSFRAKTMELS